MVVIIFWDFFIFCQIFLLPQVRRSVIIINKNGVYELPREFPKDLALLSLLKLLQVLKKVMGG